MSTAPAKRSRREQAGGPTVRRYMLVETAIGVAINVVLAGSFTTLRFAGAPLKLWGFGGLAFDFLPATFLPVLAMTVGLTWMTRRRRRAGAAPSMAAAPLPVPNGLFARGILFGIAATVLLGGLGLALLAAGWSPEVSFAAILAFKLVYGAVLGAVAAACVLIAALRDRLETIAGHDPAGRAA